MSRLGSLALGFVLWWGGIAAAQVDENMTQDGLTLTTDKPFYTVGERIFLTVKNASDREATIVRYYVVGDPSDADHDFEDLTWKVKPGKSFRWEWNHRAANRRPVGASSYSVGVQYSFRGMDPAGTINQDFEIVKEYSGDLIVRSFRTVSEVGDSYTSPVGFYALNQSKSKTAGLASSAPWRVLGWSGRQVFQPVRQNQPETIDPQGGRREWWWDWSIGRPNSDGDYDYQANPGRYQIKLTLTPPGARRATTYTLKVKLVSYQ